MEIAKNQKLFSNLFLKDEKPFVTKRDINWKRITQACALGVVTLVLVLLMLPETVPKTTEFQEKAAIGSFGNAKPVESDPASDAWAQLQQGRVNLSTVPTSTDYLHGNKNGRSNGKDRNSSMIIARSGVDGKNQLPAGTRISIKLMQKVIVSNQAMPVIGIVTKEVVHEDSVAIPQGAKIFGEASYSDGSDKAQISCKSVQYPDGRERQISGLGVSNDGQGGVEGKVHSDALKNTVGQTLTRFVGAYAEGSMQRGALGANNGGDDNGMKNAVAETAKDRAEALAQDLQKEKKWIELNSNVDFFAVLSSPFLFRDPGSYGR